MKYNNSTKLSDLPYKKLNPNVQLSKGRGKARFAPHKPLLLLCVIDLADEGKLDPPLLFKSADLRLRFESYWAICQPRWGGQPGLDLPFHYLHSQGFWKPLTREGTPSRGPHSTDHVKLDPRLISDLQSKSNRNQIRKILVESWFPEIEQTALFTALGFTKAKLRQMQYECVEEDPGLQATGRDARFRVVVVTQYRFTCALTGYGLHTRKGHSLVEAAHIHKFSNSRNNSPDNGLALSRDAHWMFDEGLWTVDDKERVVVANEVFTEWGPETEWLKRRHHKKLTFLDGVILRPNRKHFKWHFEKVFTR